MEGVKQSSLQKFERVGGKVAGGRGGLEETATKISLFTFECTLRPTLVQKGMGGERNNVSSHLATYRLVTFRHVTFNRFGYAGACRTLRPMSTSAAQRDAVIRYKEKAGGTYDVRTVRAPREKQKTVVLHLMFSSTNM